MKLPSLLLLLLFLIPFTGRAQTNVDTLSLKSVFYEPLLAGNRPDFNTFSPDGKHIYYQANDSSMKKEELFQVKLDGTNQELAPEGIKRRFTMSPDGDKLLYNKKGDIWIADPDFKNKRQLTNSKTPEYSATWSPNGKRIAFVQDGDIWILDINNTALQQVTAKQDEETGYSISGWAGNNKLILSQYDTSHYDKYYFPEYLHNNVQSGATRRGIPKQNFSIAYLDSNKVDQLFKQKGYTSSSISATGRYLALDAIDAPMKHRKIKVYDSKNKSWETVFKDSTKGWLSGTDMQFAPSGDKLMFLSEQDGWNQVYTVDPNGNNMEQHTHGEYEVPWARWTSKSEIVYASTEIDPGERHIYTLDTTDNDVSKLTSDTGFRQNFRLGPDKKYVVYKYTYFNEPAELYSLNLDDEGNKNRLTHTIPDRFKKMDWQKEDYIRFTGRDGKTKLSMSVLEPTQKQQSSSNPVVVFVHGAGSLQNVYKGWSENYYREYMFNQFLTAHGYYVIEIDYRHSTGYGREFREDVTNWMGKYETQDIEDGIDYLAEHYPEADTSSVGIYGGSYGGFMSLYATSVSPGYFDAGAALRAVTNWKNYYHTNPWYTLPRLGKPKADSANYARSSPITYVDQLEKPVLILHGLKDNNVGFQDAAQYINELIEGGNKDFEMMMYPAERHSFQDSDNWYDEYSRIFEFFNNKLKE